MGENMDDAKREFADGDQVKHGDIYEGMVIGAAWLSQRNPCWQYAIQQDDGTIVYIPEPMLDHYHMPRR